MRFLLTCSAVIILSLVLLAGCNSNDKVANSGNGNAPPGAPNAPRQPPPPPAGDTARRITTVELEDMLNRGQAIVLDVRNDAAYKQGHIKGAQLIPFSEVAQNLAKLPRDKMIVTYCS